MSLDAHLDTLYTKHAKLESQINDAFTHFQDDKVASLKKQKLIVKDEINKLLHHELRETG